jgi:hypothetical protein
MSTVAVANLQEKCSLRTCNADQIGEAKSDYCDMLASTAVRCVCCDMLHWRCGAHEGIVLAVFGEVVREIEVKEEV